MKKIIIGVLLIVAIGIGVVFAFPNSGPTNDKPQSGSAVIDANTIKLTDTGFQPTSLTVKQGETVTFTNTGNDDHWPASNNHPTHQLYPELDPKRPLASQQSWSFKFDKPGRWGMHDHLFPSFSETIVVQ